MHWVGLEPAAKYDKNNNVQEKFSKVAPERECSESKLYYSFYFIFEALVCFVKAKGAIYIFALLFTVLYYRSFEITTVSRICAN